MLAEQRHQFILSELGRSGALSVAELVRSLDVSRETVRRDLNALAARGLLVMTHGGALAADRREPSLSEREAANAEAKRTIGRRAAEFVPDDASVLIDSGSTPHAVALALADRHRLSIYTNDWRTAFVLARRNGNRVTLLGGELSDDEDATEPTRSSNWRNTTSISRSSAPAASRPTANAPTTRGSRPRCAAG